MKFQPTVIPISIFILGMFAACTFFIIISDKENTRTQPKKHHCSYRLCPFNNDTSFTHGCGLCDPGSDCYALDSLHFVYPDKDYEYLDSILFTPEETVKPIEL